jgi:hypothetical protein
MKEQKQRFLEDTPPSRPLDTRMTRGRHWRGSDCALLVNAMVLAGAVCDVEGEAGDANVGIELGTSLSRTQDRRTLASKKRSGRTSGSSSHPTFHISPTLKVHLSVTWGGSTPSSTPGSAPRHATTTTFGCGSNMRHRCYCHFHST